jgi:hypothetical protein
MYIYAYMYLYICTYICTYTSTYNTGVFARTVRGTTYQNNSGIFIYVYFCMYINDTYINTIIYTIYIHADFW